MLRLPDGRVNVQGKVVEYDPPRKLSVTWHVEWPEDFRKLPECLVTYEIAPAGEAVRLTMTESHFWEVPEAILSGGKTGWPAVLSGAEELARDRKSAGDRHGTAEGDDRGDQDAALISANRR